MKSYKRDEVAKIILMTLAVVGVVTLAAAMPNAVQLLKYFKSKNSIERTRIKKSVARLEQRGFIKRKLGSDDCFILTATGKKRVAHYNIDVAKIKRQKKWDGKWRMVMFDIPESKRMARRAINLALKKLGCAQYQKSVFITPFPCREEIDFVGEYFETRNNIRLILVEKIEDENIFKKTFNL